MKLLTKEILKKLPPLYATDGKPKDQVMVQLKLFNPNGAGTWYITEYNPEEKLAFGFATLGDPEMAELGYISIQELEEYRGRMGLGIERDIHFDPMPLSEVMETVKSGGHV
jgi:hypothetical protein